MPNSLLSPRVTFILGGARSGKSTYAEQLAQQGARVLFIATAQPGDEDMRARIAAHRAARPDAWDTLEEPVAISERMAEYDTPYDTVVLDCVTLWISNLLLAAPTGTPTIAREMADRVSALIDTIRASSARWIIVSNEVGLGIVPPTSLGRTYRDALGRANQQLAAASDRVVLLVAGIPMEVKPAPGGAGA